MRIWAPENNMKSNSDVLNLAKIKAAFDGGRIDLPAREYLESLYANGAEGFCRNFYFLGQTLGTPKTPVYAYDPVNDAALEKDVKVEDVVPAGSYIVHHRFDSDPMRNQFFTFGGTEVRLFVSSIVSVVIAAQKDAARAIDKVAGKYYDEYLAEILAAVSKILLAHKKAASMAAVSDKIESAFRAKFISNPAPEVLRLVGGMFPDISVELVRALDKIAPPHARLRDVYRLKLLFDTVPQINAFIAHVLKIMPDKVLDIRNKFYALDSPGGYRDAKIIVGFDFQNRVVPLEIIMNVRKFFDAERQSHDEYESVRENKKRAKNKAGEIHHDGVRRYNEMICKAAQYLLHRVGWNMIYEPDMRMDSFFRGFPEVASLPYSEKIVEIILEKIEDCVQNEVFRIPCAPRKLSVKEEISVFRYITRFILFAALPYSHQFEEIENMDFSGKLFNFVMKELYRYYENDML